MGLMKLFSGNHRLLMRPGNARRSCDQIDLGLGLIYRFGMRLGMRNGGPSENWILPEFVRYTGWAISTEVVHLSRRFQCLAVMSALGRKMSPSCRVSHPRFEIACVGKLPSRKHSKPISRCLLKPGISR